MIPPNAKRVFRGEIFDVYQWEQKMYDGSTKTFEGLKRPHTAEVIATVGDKIIIQEQEQPDHAEPFLCLSGGRIEEGEDPLAAAKREMLEETGYSSDTWEVLRVSRLSAKIEWAIHVFVARNCKEAAAQELDAGERIRLRLVTFDELLNLVDSGKLKRLETDTRLDCIRAKYDTKRREDFHRKIFGF